jgi:hypothetical protein
MQDRYRLRKEKRSQLLLIEVLVKANTALQRLARNHTHNAGHSFMSLDTRHSNEDLYWHSTPAFIS